MATAGSKRRYGGRALDERASDRRARLIAAAIALYGRDGYRRTGVRAVCQAAGLTERYFYESFANSDALLAAAYADLVDRVIATVRAAGEGAQQRLAAYFALLRDNPDAARVFLVEITGVSATIDAVIDMSLDRFAELILDTHDPERTGRGATEPLLRRGIVGGIYAIALAWALSDYARPLDEVVAAALPLCLIAAP